MLRMSTPRGALGRTTPRPSPTTPRPSPTPRSSLGTPRQPEKPAAAWEPTAAAAAPASPDWQPPAATAAAALEGLATDGTPLSDSASSGAVEKLPEAAAAADAPWAASPTSPLKPPLPQDAPPPAELPPPTAAEEAHEEALAASNGAAADDELFAGDATPPKQRGAALFTSAAPGVAHDAEWPPPLTAVSGGEEMTLPEAMAEASATPQVETAAAAAVGAGAGGGGDSASDNADLAPGLPLTPAAPRRSTVAERPMATAAGDLAQVGLWLIM